MTSLQKSILALMGAVVIGGFIWGAYQYPKMEAVGSPVGTTFSTAKIAAVNMAPISVTSTSTSMLNSDVSDRIVTDAGVTCTGLTNSFGATATGVDALHFYAATSSTAAPTASIVGASLAALNVIVATSSVDGFTATSTYTSPFSRRWNAGSYMVFQTNATSSALACQPFVHYLAL